MADPDHWQQADRLFHAALARDESERPAFLREACRGDERLRREVESLLTFESDAQAFMQGSAFEIAPSLIHPETTTPLAGQRLGPYEIGALLGAGGMGDVYRARDTTLGRDVAIKILPDVFTADANRRARFEREARMLAALNHPHIGAIYGFEQREGIHGLVLELVEGQTLAERLRAGPLPMPEALTIARQIAEALLAAHEKGIVHRDLKPANIILQAVSGRMPAAGITPLRGPHALLSGVGSPSRVRDDVNVKVLDFGLAKATVEEPALRPSSRQAPGVTSDGVILGTTAYMSPEQVRGKVVDTRTDIWAFGCVLYEMLTGCAAFAGETVSDTIASILDREPDWQLVPSGIPESLARLLRRCLEKDLGRRLGDIADVQIDIDDALKAFPEPGRRAPARVTAADTPTDRRLRSRGRKLSNRKAVGIALLVFAIAIGSILSLRSMRPSRDDLTYTQLTNFTDSAVAPALSPDGRMLAFIRGDTPFLTASQIYVKLLPNGEAVQLTHDPRPKYGLAFSPDGSRIAYTAVHSATTTAVERTWNTYTISPLGGEPSLLLANAAGLMWLDEHQLLFSEIKKGMHMGIVTATANRAEYGEVYFPHHERAMAHYSYASPDRRWALVVEMDERPVWQPCRLVPLNGNSSGRQVGPPGACTFAGWSPDGSWMYFSVAVDEQSHLWRQRFPNGEPEQMTFGPTQEDGISVAPDGSLVTSIGMHQSTVWIHDSRGDRPFSSEGDVLSGHSAVHSFSGLLSFSPDARRLYYLRRESAGSATELWQTDIESGKDEPVLPGISMAEYDISRDGKDVVFTTQPAGKPTQLWVAPLDRRAPPRQIASDGEYSPHFGPAGQLLFRLSENKSNYLAQMNTDGSGRSKVVPYSISTIQNISPDRRWIIAITPLSGAGETSASMAVPTGGGSPQWLCGGVCRCVWSPDGRFLYVEIEQVSRTSAGKMVAIPVVPQTGLPDLPKGGIQSSAQAVALPGSRVVEQAGIVPGLDPGTYAYVKTTMHRNLFRITLP